MRLVLRTVMMVALLTAYVSGAHAACNGGGANAIVMTVTQGLALGTFTRPDTTAADAILTVAPDGTRTVPANLNIQRDTLTPATAPHAAIVDVIGKKGCSFQITATTSSPSLLNIKFLPAAGYTLSSPGLGAIGTIDNNGQFRFTVGVSQLVGQTTPAGGSISLTVTYN